MEGAAVRSMALHSMVAAAAEAAAVTAVTHSVEHLLLLLLLQVLHCYIHMLQSTAVLAMESTLCQHLREMNR
jgi:hypothetical protein